MKLLQLFLTGWAALAPFTASCSAEPKAGTPDAGKPDVTETGDETPQNPGTTGGKTLVVWYSFTHNSEKIASALLTHISADVLEVEPAEEGLLTQLWQLSPDPSGNGTLRIINKASACAMRIPSSAEKT